MVVDEQIAYSILKIHDTETKTTSLNVFIGTLHSSSLFNTESNEYV